MYIKATAIVRYVTSELGRDNIFYQDFGQAELEKHDIFWTTELEVSACRLRDIDDAFWR